MARALTILSVFFAFFFPQSLALFDVPKYLTKCNWTDPTIDKCLAQAANDGIKALCSAGDRKFNIPRLQPSFTWSKGCILSNSTQLYLAFLPGVEIFNICSMNVSRVETIENFAGRGGYTLTYLYLKGAYVMQGTFLNNRFSGYSHGCVTFYNVTATWIPKAEIRTLPGSNTRYIDVVSMEGTFDAKRILFDLDNLDQPKQGNKFLNDHQSEIYELTRQGITQCVADMLKFYAGGYFGRLNLATLYHY